MLEEVRALGFEYAELGHNTRLSLLPGIQQAVLQKVIRISSVHNFCPLPIGVNGMAPDYYMPSARDDRERDLAVKHTLRTLECAASLKAKVVVLHLGRVTMRWPNYPRRLIQLYADQRQQTPKYERLRARTLAARERKRQRYFDQVCRALDRILPHAKELGLKLGMETRMGVEEIPSEDEADELMRRYGTDTLSYWFDNAHAQVKENMGLSRQEAVLERFRGRTTGMHLQDFIPPLYDHLPPGVGEYAFERLTPFVTEEMILSWEIHGEWDPQVIADGTKRVHERLLRPVMA